MPADAEARAAADAAARHAYGRLLAALARRSGDLAAAEDALADAFERALRVWPRDGAPDKPEAWLLTAARRRLIDAARRTAVQRHAIPDITRLLSALSDRSKADGLPDDRLRLMLACAHPALDRSLHTPLMLQAVLGLDAARIGAAFLVSPSAMGQRLSRGKARLRAAGAVFELPDAEVLPERLDAVLAAIYAAYGTGWDALGVEESPVRGLVGEAAYLADLLARLAPNAGEALGLHALIEHCEARAPARRTQDGDFVPLAEQDPAHWRAERIERAEDALRRALTLGPPRRYTLEAAIQSVHAERRATGRTNWAAAASLYDALIVQNPTLGGQVARASAHGEAFGAKAALDLLADLVDQSEVYQPYWATLAHWLNAAGDVDAAREAYRRASALSADPAVRRHLQKKTPPS